MSTKHTPGPWEQMDDGGPSRFVFTGGHSPEFPSHCIQAATVEDARLIAAAPELLAACIALIKTDDLQDAIDKARAAITKATGGTT